ncbi:MAG: hypothetical protein IPI82_17565 [Candidatus Microthrix sp.]|nr:hypothetical protein [Candidatus Microthrix sp.]MBK7324184.1 hypothetical protein [Candidatus Microthrix sp.]
MPNSYTGSTRKFGVLTAAFAAIGLLLGLAFVSPAGAQDGGDSYTTQGTTGGTGDRDADNNGIPDDVEDATLASELGSCSIANYTVNVPFDLEVFAPVDATQNFVLNQYSQSIRLFSGTAPSGSVTVTSPLAGKHSFLFYGVDADGKEAISGCTSTGVEVGGKSQPNPPGTTGGDTGGTTGTGDRRRGTSGAPGGRSTGGVGPPAVAPPVAALRRRRRSRRVQRARWPAPALARPCRRSWPPLWSPVARCW